MVELTKQRRGNVDSPARPALSAYSGGRPHDCRAPHFRRTRGGPLWERCESPRCSKTCQALYSRRHAEAMLLAFHFHPEQAPTHEMRVSRPTGLSDKRFREDMAALRRMQIGRAHV